MSLRSTIARPASSKRWPVAPDVPIDWITPLSMSPAAAVPIRSALPTAALEVLATLTLVSPALAAADSVLNAPVPTSSMSASFQWPGPEYFSRPTFWSRIVFHPCSHFFLPEAT